ncbi:MAG: BrnT family toxin [Pyrinomonadaceae bacterium]|nr:BrnT family toxin [Pyrinomonadaceae bacterium]
MIKNVEGFDWDAGNIDKCEKHGVAIADLEEMFSRPLHILADGQHSEHEDRLIAVGKTTDGRGVFVGFTFRPGQTGFPVRPITARFMHKREVEKHEKALTKTKARR